MRMYRKNQIKYTAEAAAFTAVAVCLNILIKPDDPGFSGIFYLPYAVTAVFCSVYYRRSIGFFNLLIGAAAITILGLIYGVPEPVLSLRNAIIFSSTLFLIYLFGTIRETNRLKLINTREHLKKAVKDHYRLKRLSIAQLDVNRELEDRISGQSVSITTLYNQMHNMDSLNLERSLDTLIETVQMFTEASAVTIWAQSQSPGFLQPVASRYLSGEFDSSTLLNIDESIEGWVFRNNRTLSVRTINNIEQLKKMDRGRNIITKPIPLSKKVWGVLNIEEMPFVKYNIHTERLLDIIISLSEPALTRAVEHDRQISRSETDSDTNLPLFSQMYSNLNRFITSSTLGTTRLSMLILEIRNFNELTEAYAVSELKRLFLNLTDDILMASAGLAEFYMFKSDNQMAVLVPGIDSDGTSLLCLEILEKVNTNRWKIGTSEINLEMIIGYSSLGENASDAEGLITHAEHLLEIQKI